MSDFIVFAQIDGEAVHDVSLQALALARRLADASGGKVAAVSAGSGVSGPAASLFGYGADEVFAADDERLAGYVARPYRRVLSAWLAGREAAAVLFPASTLGDDLAPSLAASMGLACVLDADALAADGTVTAGRAEYDRKIMSRYAPVAGGPVIVSLRDGAAEALAPDTARTGTVQPVEVVLDEADLVSRVLRRDVAERTVNLKAARIVVAAGAGVGSAEGLAVVQELAGVLGAEVGATRAVVDAGWLPADHQVGQTGATVRPDLYIACGISGAVQHRVGMMDSAKIVAINTDPNAPIFRIAHYRITGDLKVVVPKLVKLLRG